MHALHFSSLAARAIRDCPLDLREALLEAVQGLARDPRPPGCRKLSGALAGSRRIRVRHYRVLYDIDDRRRAVLVTKIGPRKSIYR